MQPQVPIPSKPSTLSLIYIVEIETAIVIAMRNGQKQTKKVREWPSKKIFKDLFDHAMSTETIHK